MRRELTQRSDVVGARKGRPHDGAPVLVADGAGERGKVRGPGGEATAGAKGQRAWDPRRRKVEVERHARWCGPAPPRPDPPCSTRSSHARRMPWSGVCSSAECPPGTPGPMTSTVC